VFGSATPHHRVEIALECNILGGGMNSSPKTRIDFVQSSVVFTFAAIERRYERLCDLLEHYPIENHDDETVAVAWDIIDWAERLRTLLHHATGVKASDPWLRSFRRELAPVQQMRNVIQHLPGSVEECLRAKVPLFGFVSAYCLDPKANGYCIVVAVASPSQAQEISDPSLYLQANIVFHPPVDQVCFQVGKHRVNLTNFMAIVRNGRIQFEQRTKVGTPNRGAEGS
jgi:hypothetical protein